MRIIVICGDSDCGEEYPAETNDRLFLCPHCGRERENKYYPFLTAKLMHAKIEPEKTDWKELHEELLDTARRKAAELRDRIEFLDGNVEKLRVRLPSDAEVESERPVGDPMAPGFIDDWAPEDVGSDNMAWREIYDTLLEGAHGQLVALEGWVPKLENELRRIKETLKIA